ncbi:MAG: divalent metal cation transporter [Woeseiaceae bacterium]|nr:divalent metal cation transporter [Woeseiaceae bacterium]
MTTFLSRFGPGMMLAAASVGVSHLVFSTQAGANYGLSLIWFVCLIVLLKYPAFRFAVQYAGATGDSLVNGYAKISKIAIAWLLVGFFVDMFIATSAVAMLTSGLMISIFDLPFSGPQVAVALTVVTAVVLANGHYAKAEGIVKVLVLAFSLLTVVTMLFALPLLGSDDRAFFAELTPDRSLAVFMIAIAGWMPIPTNAAVLLAEWVKEKRDATSGRFEVRSALFDFHISYALALVIAVCFIIMGTATLFETGRAVPQNAAAFATELFSVFTRVIGDWMYPLIVSTALAVVWSTQVALMDAMPRVMDRLTAVITRRPPEAPRRYTHFLVLQVVGVSLIVLFLLKSFSTFIVFATSMGFIAAPAIAYYNYVAVTSSDVPEAQQPRPGLVTWNWIAVIIMAAFAIAFIYTQVG